MLIRPKIKYKPTPTPIAAKFCLQPKVKIRKIQNKIHFFLSIAKNVIARVKIARPSAWKLEIKKFCNPIKSVKANTIAKTIKRLAILFEAISKRKKAAPKTNVF